MVNGLRVLLTHPGTQYSYALAEQLHRLGMLQRFATGIATGQGSWGPLRWLRSRRVRGVPDRLIARQVMLEWRTWLALRRHPRQREAILARRNQQFQQRIPEKWLRQADVVIGFDTASWVLAERCRSLGKPFVLDASIAHPLEKLAVYGALVGRFSAWAHELQPKAAHLIQQEEKEMELASHIVCASQYTKSTYMKHGVEEGKISVNHYGTDLKSFACRWGHARGGATESAVEQRTARVRFLFFGSLTLRKGLPWLLEVWEQLPALYARLHLKLAGYGSLPKGCHLPQGVEVLGAISPQRRAELYAASDVLVFPSFFEGFAQVILEAMATGMPVITTTATVGPELIQDGINGFVVHPGDNEALRQAILHFAANPARIAPMGRMARQAVDGHRWEAYGLRWQKILQQVVSHDGAESVSER